MATYVVQYNQLLRPSTLVVAYGEEKPMSVDRGDQLLGKQRKQCTTNEGKVKVVQLEQEAELQRLAAPHHLPPAKYYNVVCDKDARRGLERRDGRLAGHIAKILCRVSEYGFPSSAKDGPQREAEGPVERRGAEFYERGLAHGGTDRRIGCWGNQTLFCGSGGGALRLRHDRQMRGRETRRNQTRKSNWQQRPKE